MVHAQTDPAGQFSAAGTLSPSDCYPVGPVGPYATGGPVGPDVYITDPNSLKHVVRTPPDPHGQDATTGPVGPYVGGGPVGPDDCLPVLESCKHLYETFNDLPVYYGGDRYDSDADDEFTPGRPVRLQTGGG